MMTMLSGSISYNAYGMYNSRLLLSIGKLTSCNRYFYAIVTCDTVDAAAHIYEELEGTELERSANIFDLSFVPEDMSFDDEWR